ncbi:MAG: metallophosphoesterase family protein [Lachnospiraceae bacterium]|nr:metallophosphoesterase family protein [Lachnospiraceae bacterium]
MKILVVADEEEKRLWDFYDKERTEGVDLIISCGDLHPDYLQFLVTVVNKPLLYVRGNHDRKYDDNPPCGCDDIDDMVYDFNGLRILGLGGSMRYKPGGDMYTEEEMAARIKKLTKKIYLMNGFDIFVAHSPAKGYGDMEDIPHQGFECFNELMNRWRPLYMLHGHVHQSYSHNFERERIHESGTKIINCYGSYILEIDDNQFPDKGKTGSALYDLYVAMKERERIRRGY